MYVGIGFCVSVGFALVGVGVRVLRGRYGRLAPQSCEAGLYLNGISISRFFLLHSVPPNCLEERGKAPVEVLIGLLERISNFLAVYCFPVAGKSRIWCRF